MESEKQDKGAPDTTELGRTINKIREGMADFETRILWCENMLTPSNTSLRFEWSDTETIEALHILTRKDKQKTADILFLASKLKALKDEVLNFEEQFQNFLRLLYQKEKKDPTKRDYY